MRVLLLQTRRRPGFGLNGFIALEPLGPEVVAALLKGHDIRILDFFRDRDLVKEIRDHRPHAVGIGCAFTTDAPRPVSLASAVKFVSPEISTFVGGHHPSQVPGDFRFPAFDAVVVGDGEATTPDLINAIGDKHDLRGLPGVIRNSPEGQAPNPEPSSMTRKKIVSSLAPVRSLTFSTRSCRQGPPLGEFYWEFAALYRNAYFGGRGKWNLARFLIKRLPTGKVSVAQAMRLREGARLLTDAEAYLVHHMCTAPAGAHDCAWKMDRMADWKAQA